MFERFTKDAREVVVEAHRDATEVGAPEVTPLHLLVALLRGRESAAARLLIRLGVPIDEVVAEAARVRRRAGISEADAEALGEFGIDVDKIIDRIEELHGPGALAGTSRDKKAGHLPFADDMKRTLELTLREVVERGEKNLGSEHILVALTVLRGPAADVLARFDVDAPKLRAALS
ncbi:Clp protease N-terminal domain-containing protein [Amycolatopsis sp. GM8]|uniref:Clp protease N-terminal domain-containing protein n=1 Tax=Amycolatopsis sp. GM8 TaxID=2896530 RepID=UPI001F4371B6|nr:Clp protease N-terminal domain-containing protein [Amycolatopsis sp. GM8]